MDIEILSRKQIEKLLYHGGIDTDTAIISFCDEERKPVNLTLTKASSFKVIADDLDMDELLQNGGYDNFFSTAKAAARFVFAAVSRGKKIICQCEYGQSRSAGCAAAILEYFEGFGAKIFSDPSFYPSQAVYNKLYKALCVIGAQRDDELRLRRAIPDKEQIISIIKDSIVQKYAESIYIILGDKKLHFFDALTDDDSKTALALLGDMPLYAGARLKCGGSILQELDTQTGLFSAGGERLFSEEYLNVIKERNAN